MFQSSLIESAPASTLRRALRLPLGVAAVLHGAAGLVIAGAALWSVGDQPDPPSQLVFLETRVPPPTGGRAQEGAVPASRRASRALVQPAEIPREIPLSRDIRDRAAETAVRESSAPGGAGTSDGIPSAGEGTEDGVPGGIGDPSPGRERAIPATSATEMPVLTLRIEPAYPDAARRIHSEGLVVLEAVISGTGVVEEVRVIRSASPLLDAAAVRAVEQWRYRPATLNGRAVRVALSVTVRFSLH